MLINFLESNHTLAIQLLYSVEIFMEIYQVIGGAANFDGGVSAASNYTDLFNLLSLREHNILAAK